MSVFFKRRGDAPSSVDYKTWYFNERITWSSATEFDANFTSYMVDYTAFLLTKDGRMLYSSPGSGTTAYSSGGWYRQEYRTVVFDDVPTGSLRTWLEANATPI